jgi:hypothetical protein
MGAIFAILGEAGDPELAERLQRMLARSPHRGAPEFLVEGPLGSGTRATASASEYTRQTLSSAARPRLRPQISTENR